MLASIFGLIFHDVTSGRVTFAFALVDQDRGEAAQAFRTQALAPLERRGLITVHREPSLAAGRRAADEGAVAATIALPTGLTTAIRRGGPVAINVVGDVDAPIGAQVAESIAQSFASRIETARVARAALGPSAHSPQVLGADLLALEDISTKSRQLDPGTFYAADLAVFSSSSPCSSGSRASSTSAVTARSRACSSPRSAQRGARRQAAHERRARRREHGQFVGALDRRPSTVLRRYADRAALQRAVGRGQLDAGLVLPPDYDASVAAGRPAALGYLARPDSVAQQLTATIQSVAAEQSRAFVAARLIVRAEHTAFTRALARASGVGHRAAGARARERSGRGAYAGTESRFEAGASTQLLLSVFLTSLSGAVWLIETRRLGIARRMLSTPTSTRTILAGQVLGRLAIALVQALIIVVGSLLAFGVAWGGPLGTAAVILSFALVGTGPPSCSEARAAQGVRRRRRRL